MRRERIEIGLSVEQDAEPVTGELRAGTEPPRRFEGWTQLIAAIDAARGIVGRTRESRSDSGEGRP